MGVCVYSLEGVALAGVEFWGGPHPFTLKALALTKYCTPCILETRAVIAVHHPCHPSSEALSLLIHPPGAGKCSHNAGGAEEEEDDWRAINTICVDMCVRVCWRVFVPGHDLPRWVPWCCAKGSWSQWLAPSQGCVWSWLTCSIPLHTGKEEARHADRFFSMAPSRRLRRRGEPKVWTFTVVYEHAVPGTNLLLAERRVTFMEL